MKFGHRLKTIRTAKNIEPLVMADMLSISESTYRRYERDQSEPTLSILYRMAEIFDVNVADLLGDKIEISLTRLERNKPK
jgi:transcriptional regulator with XRE-family HTH domain